MIAQLSVFDFGHLDLEFGIMIWAGIVEIFKNLLFSSKRFVKRF